MDMNILKEFEAEGGLIESLAAAMPSTLRLLEIDCLPVNLRIVSINTPFPHMYNHHQPMLNHAGLALHPLCAKT